VVGFTTGSRGEVPGKKENVRQEMMMMMMMMIIIIIIIIIILSY
jgi:predicted nucleic acid-binding Zn ribbon protein